MLKKMLPFLALVGIVAGCATLTKSTITNLTPTFEPRNGNNLYAVSAQFDTRQATIKKETLQGFVMIGSETYPMQKTPMVANRWETLIPIPPNKKSIYYQIKFVYQFNRIPEPRTDSRLSPQYELNIVDKR